ncbi:MAG TPA: DNA-binding domain-containing protein [Polyangiales bacterium]
MADLRTLQEAFWTAITAAEGTSDLRLNVYANMYFYRLRDNLALDFPVLADVLGPARFHNLITDYLLAHPSQDPNVRNVGRALPAFLSGWLSDLAALEWARLDVYDRADQPVLRDLHGHAREGFAGLTLRSIRAHTLVPVQYEVEAVWRTRAGEAARRPHVILVWRKDSEVHHRPLDADERELWPALNAGVSFAELCAQLPLPMERAAERALQLLCSWTASELLVA